MNKTRFTQEDDLIILEEIHKSPHNISQACRNTSSHLLQAMFIFSI